MNQYFKNPMDLLEQTKTLKKILEYVKIDTQSAEHVEKTPSTDKQMAFGRKLVDELKTTGLKDASIDDNSYVTATLPGNSKTKTVIGFLAHLDTAPAASGKDVKPTLHKNYDGKKIKLKNGVVIDPADDPNLKKCIGDTVITSDGTTLLGADDKAGIAEIMGVMEYLISHPEIPRPTIKVGFTPDEETGRGALKFPIKKFGADVAFTLDGSFDGELNVETFNADSAFVTFKGVSTHPGTAKNKMVNAMRYMSKFIDKLPPKKSPECTEKREGFIHPYQLDGDAGECNCQLILRDFEEDKLKKFGDIVKKTADEIAKMEPRLKVKVEIKRSYPNMGKFLKEKPEILENLVKATIEAGVEPKIEPIRGGTDGSNLTMKGLPCPNIFTGGMNFHGPTEWISTRSMGLAMCTVLNLIILYSD